MSLKVAITGNIGSGKTTVTKLFSELQIPVFYADTVAKACYKQAEVHEHMVSRFGPEIYDSNNNIAASLLSSIIFTDPGAMAFVEQLIHPLVQKSYQQWLENHTQAPYTLYEAAILFEKKREKDFDKVIYVYAPEALRIERVIARDQTDRHLLKKRMDRQWDDEKKMRLADFIIYNEDLQTLPEQVKNIHFQIID